MKILVDLWRTNLASVSIRPSPLARLFGAQVEDRMAVRHAQLWYWDVGGQFVGLRIQRELAAALRRLGHGEAVVLELESQMAGRETDGEPTGPPLPTTN